MQNMTNWIFYEGQSSASTTADMKPYKNVQSDLVAVEVSGTASAMTIKMQGRSNHKNND